ncbi:MAG: condensation domain-containing protein, partial [Pyrinomonadaceae bacterium]
MTAINKSSNVEDIYPLSPMQEGMLFHALYAPRGGVYVEQQSWRFEGRLNIPAFKQAWQVVVDRHPILRTAFIYENRDKPLQLVRRRVLLEWQHYDWRALSDDAQQHQLQLFLRADRERGFQLSKPPLLRFTLIRIDEATFEIVWTHHHLLLDGWSEPLLLREVGYYYQLLCQGQSKELEKPRPFRDYITWLKEQDMGAAEQFWRERLKGFTSPTPLGVDRADGEATALEGQFGQHQVRLTPEATSKIQAFLRQLRLTMNTLLQGAWALLLSQYSGHSDVVFGATVAGRPAELAGVEAMIGLFINTAPVRVQIPSGETAAAWLKRLQERQAEERRYEYTPLVQLHGWSQMPRDRNLFESLLVFENYPVPGVRFGANGSAHAENGNGNGNGSYASVEQPPKGDVEMSDVRAYAQAHYPLTLAAGLVPELFVRILYDGRRFDPQTITRLGQHLETALYALTSESDKPLHMLSIFTQAERRQMLVEWNQTTTEYPRSLCLHQLFSQQARSAPDRLALSYDDSQLSYGALDSLSNRLAHHLRASGARPGTVVALAMSRSLSLITAMLAVLKTGAAYLPLDPSYPLSRRAFMLEDAGACLLVTDDGGHDMGDDVSHALT